MKITIEQIDKRVADAAAAREKMEEQQRQRADERDALISEGERYAEKGDVDGYLRCKGQIERLDALDHIADVQLRKTPQIVEDDEIREAWDNYASDYNAKMSKGLAALEKASAELLRVYGTLYEAQKAALQIRARLEQYAGDEHVLDGSTEMLFIPVRDPNGPGVVRPNFGPDPNCVYFMAASVKNPVSDSWKVAEILSVIQRHTLRAL